MTSQVRRAAHDDIPELVRLRALLFAELDQDGTGHVPGDAGWRDALTAVLKEQLAAESVRILVVDGERGLAACGIGTVQQRLPGPHLPNGLAGQVLGVVTDPAYRRRGHSRAVMCGLLDWFRECETGRVDLYASRDGEPLYRSLGFTAHRDPSLCLRM
ncbi:Ribosomal protein S18 acetylase RimI [Streptomyces sp. WMMB 714]|uniref:GNAT family N-acetyltransferase n=1 Tax=Streptomyces sp. WMMB 714 TaxID=1286822 RepID=UPI0005F7BEA1|nr:GNAT family N-acetyltransferase [Streptomyces sp. WMMB 714]SCK06200.1 Ribosomal protein S18 acetylase RimI [Streptomyces sp. WMMB 714]